MMWLFRRFADTDGLRSAARRIQAHLLEFWLFVDEPRLVGKFWLDLLRANARLLRLLLVPLAIVALPSAPLIALLDSCYGRAPLAVGKPALVTIGVPDRWPDHASLTAPEGISIETPPVRAISTREISWRIRPQRPVSGNLRCTADGAVLEKGFRAGGDFACLNWKRSRSSHAGAVAWMEVSYPSARVAIAGIAMHWSLWVSVLSLAGAGLVLARRGYTE